MVTFKPFNVPPYLQPDEDSCVATVLKTICDNQFNTFKISIRQINTILREKTYLGVGNSTIHRMPCYGVEPKIVPKILNPHIRKFGVQVANRVDCKLKDIEGLLNKDIYPFIYYPMNKLNHWQSPNGWKTKPMVCETDDDVPFHCMLLNGIDENTGTIYGHDPASQLPKISLKDKQAYYYITKDLFFNGWKHYAYEVGWIEKSGGTAVLDQQTKINVK